MRILLDDKVGKEHGLNANEASVYAAIARFSNGMGWYANYETMAQSLPFVISEKTVQRAVSKLIGLGIVEKRQNVLFARTNCPEKETNCPNSGTNCPSPHTPLYNISQEKNIINRPAYLNDRRRRPEVDVDSLAFFSQYYQLFPCKAKTNAIKHQTQNEFVALPRDKQQAIINRLRNQLANGIKLPDTSPLMYIRHFDPDAPPHDEPPENEGQPTNYNNTGSPPPDAKPALYNGEWGMYTQADIDKYHLLTKEKVKPPPS